MSTKPNIQKVHNQQALGLSIYILIILLVLGCDDYKIVPVRTAQVVLHPVSKNTNSASLKSSNEPELLMQASGWIEPDPFSVRIPALYDGFVNEVYVHEGELVRTGQKLVSLIADDAQLAFRMAHNELEEAKSREHEIALELSLQKLSLEKAQYENLKHLALLNEQEDLLDRLESLPVGSIPFRDLNRTRYKTESM